MQKTPTPSVDNIPHIHSASPSSLDRSSPFDSSTVDSSHLSKLPVSRTPANFYELRTMPEQSNSATSHLLQPVVKKPLTRTRPNGHAPLERVTNNLTSLESQV